MLCTWMLKMSIEAVFEEFFFDKLKLNWGETVSVVGWGLIDVNWDFMQWDDVWSMVGDPSIPNSFYKPIQLLCKPSKSSQSPQQLPIAKPS